MRFLWIEELNKSFIVINSKGKGKAVTNKSIAEPCLTMFYIKIIAKSVWAGRIAYVKVIVFMPTTPVRSELPAQLIIVINQTIVKMITSLDVLLFKSK